jgi:hypothetical protein
MVTLVKHEWHQVDSQFAFDLDCDKLSEIYPELEEEEIDAMMEQIKAGEVDVNEIISEAWDNDVEIEWERQYDDWWTDRKGGYEVTYELGNEKSWHTPPEEAPDTTKCTKCRWTGKNYETRTQHHRADGTVIEDYYATEEVSDHTTNVCPMCDSLVELTEAGVAEEAKRKAQKEKWSWLKEVKQQIDLDEGLSAVNEQEEETAEEEAVPCFSCGAMHKESELPEMSGQLFCPSCNEGWVVMDMREEETEEELVAPAWPFPEVEVLPNYPAGEYTIRIWGRTREIGVGTISKEQYEHWSDDEHEDDLSDALNESYDYDENETPENARFNHAYYEYQDVKSFWGFDEDDTHMTITNDNGEEIYEGTLEDFIYEAHGDRASRWEATEEEEELYPEHLGTGYFVMWTQGGKGSCIQTTIDTIGQEFDPRKLSYKTWDVQGSSIVHRLSYDGGELEDEGMDSGKDNWRGQWSEFSVHHNE